jgi:hypothetical protein
VRRPAEVPDEEPGVFQPDARQLAEAALQGPEAAALQALAVPASTRLVP